MELLALALGFVAGAALTWATMMYWHLAVSAINKRKENRQLLIRFSNYLNKRCDINVANMVRPFLERER